MLTQPEKYAKYMILNCPTTYRSRWNCARFMFLANGNGFYWKNGILEAPFSFTDKELEDMKIYRNYENNNAFNFILNSSDEKYNSVKKTLSLNLEFENLMLSFLEKNIDDIVKIDLPDSPYNHRSSDLSGLSFDSLIFKTPTNATPEWKEFVIYTLKGLQHLLWLNSGDFVSSFSINEKEAWKDEKNYQFFIALAQESAKLSN